VVKRSSADHEFKDGKAAAKQESSDHARAESESQSAPEVRAQGSGHGGSSEAWPARGVKDDLTKVTLARKIAGPSG
jgi:hypothetical protein